MLGEKGMRIVEAFNGFEAIDQIEKIRISTSS